MTPSMLQNLSSRLGVHEKAGCSGKSAQGRQARDARHHGEAADVISSGRVIEVKAYGGSARGSDLWLEVRQVEEARASPEVHVYVVENVRQGDPSLFRLIDLHGETLARLLVRAKEQRYCTNSE